MIVGTAGHVDHGKTALVKALTGVDTDRLREEKARGITIDLGFAYLPAAGGSVLGFVDMPGHERFVRNMLAGATGIDFVLLVVAADDGVMPQTREHFDIVTLLGLSRGFVALTKADLVAPGRITEVAAQVESLTRGTPLAGSPIFPVSAANGAGVAALRDALTAEAEARPARNAEGLFRLAVDRCFSIRGAGTVVTGAVLSGSVGVGDTVTVSPSGLRARVRAIHAQNRPVARGRTGERCALNLAGEGVGVDAIRRGDMVLDDGAHAPADRIDAELHLLPGEPRPLAHWTPVRVHHAASETAARAALLQEEPIAPGSTGRVQLVLERLIAAAVGDRFIIRDTSASRTMGGGRFIDLRGPERRRRSPARRAQLHALARADPADTLSALLDLPPFAVAIADFARDRALGGAELEILLARVPHVRAAVDGNLMFSPAAWKSLSGSARRELEEHHRLHPQLLGVGAAWLAARLSPAVTRKVGAVVVRSLVAAGDLTSEGGLLRLPDHRLALDGRDHGMWQRILPHLSGEGRFRPPLARECAGMIGEREPETRRVLKAMARQKSVVEVAPDRFFLKESVEEMAGIAAELAAAREDGLISAADFRDRLGNGRKVAIEILEYFDRAGITVRRGDQRQVVPHRVAEFVFRMAPAGRSNETMEENRPRWGVRTSNPGGAVSQSRVGSTPTLFRQSPAGPGRKM